MKKFITPFVIFYSLSAVAQNINPYKVDNSEPAIIQGMKLVFSEEFNYSGKPDSAKWNFETGYKRNEELQWYQSENVNCKNGILLIEGRNANFKNPNFNPESKSWKKNREIVEYTSGSINTAGKKSWLFGRFEVRARIDTTMSSWPAIWLLGEKYEWPSCGEIDMMEFYRRDGYPFIMANVAYGTGKRWNAKWDATATPLSEFLISDKKWTKKFHIWRMDWTKDSINLYLDNKLLNTTLVNSTINADGTNPFLQPQYILLNLAIGSNGGDPDKSKFPIKYEVDYVRVYQQVTKNQ